MAGRRSRTQSYSATCLHSFCRAHGKAIREREGGDLFLPARPWTDAAVARIPSTLHSQEIAHYYKGEWKEEEGLKLGIWKSGDLFVDNLCRDPRGTD